MKPIETMDAACPGCGDNEIIYGHRIVSVSDEAGTLPAPNSN